MDEEQIISAVDLIKMRPFVAQRSLFRIGKEQAVKPAFLRTLKIRIELGQIDLTVAIYDIDPVVIVEKKRAVMIESLNLTFAPRTFDLLRTVKICFPCVVTDEDDVKSSLMIAKTCRPHAFSIDMLIALKPLCIRAVQMVENIRGMLPVDKVAGAQDLPSGKKMHRGGDHVIEAINEDHIRIRKVHFKTRVLSFDQLAHSCILLR